MLPVPYNIRRYNTSRTRKPHDSNPSRRWLLLRNLCSCHTHLRDNKLAKENKKFQYKVVQRGGSAALFGESIECLAQAGIVLKCQKIDHGTSPIAVYADLSSFKLYMSDVGLLVMKSGVPQQTILTGESNVFMGSVTENYVAQALAKISNAVVL